MRILRRKRFVIPAIAGIIALVGGGVAYAFFTAGGTGTGSANVGTSTNWTIHSTAPAALLYPDAQNGEANLVNVPYTVLNTGKGDQGLTSVTISVANSLGAPWWVQSDPTKPACDSSDFSIGGAAPGTPFVDTSLAATYTPSEVKAGSVTLEMIDNGLNQDNCQGVTVPLYFSAAPPPVPNPDLTLDTPPPSGSGGWYPNGTFAPVPTVTVGETDVNLVVTAIQPGPENSDGTFTLTYDNTFLTFTGTSGDGTCAAPVVSGDSSTVACSFTDLDNSDTSKPFDFTPLQAGETFVTAVVNITGSGTATETFPLSIAS